VLVVRFTRLEPEFKMPVPTPALPVWMSPLTEMPLLAKMLTLVFP
jgi:hypothetical protein